MTGLLRAEFHRLLVRKGIWVAVAAGVAMMVLVVGLPMGAAAQPPSAQQVAEARASFDEAKKYWEANHEADYQACSASSPVEPGMCEALNRPPVEADFLPHTTSLTEAITVAGEAGSVFGALISLLVAATFWGADYRHGTLATWLTFQPSRVRVWGSRMIVLAVAGAIIAAVIGAVALALAIGAVWAWQGGAALTAPGPGLGVAARGIGLGAASACLGGSMAVLFRQTVAAIVLPFGYFIIAQLLPIVPGYRFFVRYLPDVNIAAYLNNGTSVWLYDPGSVGGGPGQQPAELVIPFGHGLAYVLIATVSILAVAAWSFSRRDVD